MVESKDKKPVVLQILPELEHGGVEWGTVQVAEALKQHGYDNFVASKGGRLVYELNKLGVEHLTLPLKTKNPVKMYLNVAVKILTTISLQEKEKTLRFILFC